MYSKNVKWKNLAILGDIRTCRQKNIKNWPEKYPGYERWKQQKLVITGA